MAMNVLGYAAQSGKDALAPYRFDRRDPRPDDVVIGKNGITSDVEVIKIQDINEAYERMLKSDVKYRFVIDMASLKE